MGLGLSGLRLGLGQRGGVGIVPNIYVDSVAGNDSNDGLTAATALKTISAAQTAATNYGDGAIVGFKRGGYWRGNLNFAAATGCRAIAYGDETDPMPRLDGCAVATNASFSPTGGYTDVYEISWTHEITATNAHHQAYLNSEPLDLAADLTALDAASSGFYWSGSANTSPLTMYVKVPGGGAPGAGHYIEFTKYRCGVEGDTSGSNVMVRGIHATRPGLDGGGIVLNGDGSTIDGCLMTLGGRHNGFVWADRGAIRNSVAFLSNLQSNVYSDYTPLVAYSDGTPTGSATVTAVYTRPFREDASVTGAAFLATGLYAHTNGGASRIETLTVSDSFFYGTVFGATCANTDTYSVNKCWFEQCRNALGGGDVLTVTDVQSYSNNTDMGANQSKFISSGGATSATVTDCVNAQGGSNTHFSFATGATVTMQRVMSATGKTFPNNGTLTSIDISDSIIGYSQDLQYAQVAASGGNVYQNNPSRNFNDGVSTYATLALYKAAQPSLEENSVEATSFPLQSDIFAARSISGAVPAEAATGGRDCTPRVTLTAPDWGALMPAWDHGYIGISGARPGAEVVIDPTFDTTTEWQVFGWTITGNGEASLATVSGFNSFRDEIAISDGAKVAVEVVVSDYASGEAAVHIGDESQPTTRVNFDGYAFLDHPGTFRGVITHAPGTPLRVAVKANNGFTGTITKVSVREIS